MLKDLAKGLEDDARRGLHVRNQLVVWEALLEARIRVQKLLQLANSMPRSMESMHIVMDENAQVKEQIEQGRKDAIEILNLSLHLRKVCFVIFFI